MKNKDIEIVLKNYDLGSLNGSAPLDRYNLSRPWRISTETGEYVVRECFLNEDPSDLAFEHALALWLQDRGFPVSVPIRTRRGKTWYEIERRLFAVYTLIPGGHYQAGNGAQARSAGGALAWFHQASRTFPQARNRRLPAGYRNPTDNIRFLLKSCSERAEVTTLAAEFEELDRALPHLHEELLFNDLHAENLLFVGDRFSGAFDLDCCFWGPRLLDVAKSLLAFALSFEGEEGTPSSPLFSVTCAQSWLSGYQERQPLLSEELEALPGALRREVRANALYDLREVVESYGRWVKHEWTFSRSQIGLVDVNSAALAEDLP